MIDRSRIAPTALRQPLFKGIRAAFALLTARELRRAVLLLLSMQINALFNLVGLASVVPFVHLMLSSDPLGGDSQMSRLLRMTGTADVNMALALTGGAIVLLNLGKNIYTVLHTRWQNLFCAHAELRVSTYLLGRAVAAPYDWLATQNSAVLREMVQGHVSEWARNSLRTTLQLGSEIVFLVFTIVLLLIVSPLAGVSGSALAVVLALLLLRSSRPFIMRYAEQKRRAGRMAGVSLMEAIMGGRDVRMSNAGDLLVRTFAKEQRDYAMADVHGREWQLVPRLGVEVVGFAALIGISLGAVWSGASRADVGSLLALYAVVAARAIPVVSQAVTSVGVIAASLPTVAELSSLLNGMPNVKSVPPLKREEIFTNWRRVALEDVSYRYPGAAKPAIESINLTIMRGASLGIIGMSGAGKSTLIDVLVSLLEPTQGAVTVDAVPLEPETLAAWRARIGYVAQSPFLLDATLAENIEFGAPGTADRLERCRAAAEAAGLGGLLSELPKGLDTPIGDRGLQLSGGQRQRVAIARALYRNADLLVLDEATSALDSVIEQEIVAAIDELKGKLTLVIVAHRLSTVARCDEILVLEAGHIVARGSHAQLLVDCPAYRRLVEAQSLTVEALSSEAAQ